MMMMMMASLTSFHFHSTDLHLNTNISIGFDVGEKHLTRLNVHHGMKFRKQVAPQRTI